MSTPTAAPFEFSGFKRREGEDVCDYVDRWLAHQKQYRPWEHKGPVAAPDVRMPYPDERDPGEEG